MHSRNEIFLNYPIYFVRSTRSKNLLFFISREGLVEEESKVPVIFGWIVFTCLLSLLTFARLVTFLIFSGLLEVLLLLPLTSVKFLDVLDECSSLFLILLDPSGLLVEIFWCELDGVFCILDSDELGFSDFLDLSDLWWFGFGGSARNIIHFYTRKGINLGDNLLPF